jgi:hypothetical protein
MTTIRVICNVRKIIRNYVVLHSDQTNKNCGMLQHIYTYTYNCNVTRQGSIITCIPYLAPEKVHMHNTEVLKAKKESNINRM